MGSRPEPGSAAEEVDRATAASPAGRDWARLALRLVTATFAYNVLEAVVALAAGVRAGSIALEGFGLDSAIECVAAGALLWRLRVEARGADAEVLERAERRVGRVVGVTFLLLAAWIVVQASATLWLRHAPDESVVGIALAALSLVAMPLLALGKMRAAGEIGSEALRAEAKETLACAWLSFALLLGLLANALLGWWWSDPLAALIMVPWLVHEGLEGVRGEE